MTESHLVPTFSTLLLESTHPFTTHSGLLLLLIEKGRSFFSICHLSFPLSSLFFLFLFWFWMYTYVFWIKLCDLDMGFVFSHLGLCGFLAILCFGCWFYSFYWVCLWVFFLSDEGFLGLWIWELIFRPSISIYTLLLAAAAPPPFLLFWRCYVVM